MDKNNWKRNIAAFLTRQAISLFGSSIVQFAIIWYVARETQSGIQVTLMTLCGFLPQVIISLFAGVWADRYNRKTLIIAADFGIALSSLILALIIMSNAEFKWVLLIVTAIRSLGAGIQTPAVNALIPQIVPEDQLMRVNGINGSVQSMINLVAPAVSGAVLSWGAIQYIMFIDVITAAIGITIFLFIPVKTHEKAMLKQKGGYFTDLKDGLAYCFSNKFIKQTLAISSLFMFLIVPSAFLNVLFVTRTFGDSYWNLTLNEMTFFVGTMAGGIILSAWGGFKNRIMTVAVGTFVYGMTVIAFGFTKVFWLYLIIMVITGLSIPFSNSPIMVLMQEKVSPDMQGRVFSLMQIVSSLVLPIGMAVFGPLSDYIRIQWLMIGTGIALLILVVFVRFNKSFYNEGWKKPDYEKTMTNT